MSSQVVNKIRDTLLSIKETPRELAHTMPPEFFTSPEFLELEKEQLFRKEWICLGHESEIKNKNDFFTTELVDEQLIVVRDEDMVIRVLSNVCRHRQNMIVQGSGNKKRFSCPYHAWTYANDGQLTSAKLMDQVEGFNMKKCKLHQFACEVWQGFIFVNLDGSAEPLSPRLASIDRQLKNYHIGERTSVFTDNELWNTNWKCLTENFMEGYHLTPTHRTTLAKVNPTSLCEKLPNEDAFTAYRSGYIDGTGMEPSHPDMTESERNCSLLFCIYPSLVISVDPNTTLYLALRSDEADKVAIKWGVTAYDETNSGTGVSMDENIEFMKSFNAEDKAKLETLQKGLKSKYIERGALAPADYEGTVWDFYQYMASKLGSDINLES